MLVIGFYVFVLALLLVACTFWICLRRADAFAVNFFRKAQSFEKPKDATEIVEAWVYADSIPFAVALGLTFRQASKFARDKLRLKVFVDDPLTTAGFTISQVLEKLIGRRVAVSLDRYRDDLPYSGRLVSIDSDKKIAVARLEGYTLRDGTQLKSDFRLKDAKSIIVYD